MVKLSSVVSVSVKWKFGQGDNIPEPGVPESFKVLLKELQSLGLDIKVLREDNTEVEIMESVDYTDSDYRYEIEGDTSGRDYNQESFAANGYTEQSFNEDGELVADESDADGFDEEGFDDFDESSDEE